MIRLALGGIAGLVALALAIPLVLVAPGQPSGALTGVPPQYVEVIGTAAAACPGLPAPLLAAQLQRESAWNPAAVSSAGAQGLAQFLPSTWARHGVDATGEGVADPFDPVDAIWSAALYDCALRRIVQAVPGDPLRLMLAAYNAGPHAVLKYGGIPPYPETVEYVRAIFAALPALTQQVTSGAAGLTPRAAAVRQLVIDRFGVSDIGGFASSGHIDGSDHYSGRAVDIMLLPMGPEQTELGWRIATFLQSNAQRLGITYLIWQGRIWSARRSIEGWRAYTHPSGATTPTLMHLDHVHVSVS